MRFTDYVSTEGGRGCGDTRTRQVCPNFSRTHMHQDVIAAKKGKSAVPKNCVGYAWAGLVSIALGRVEKRVGVVGGRL